MSVSDGINLISVNVDQVQRFNFWISHLFIISKGKCRIQLVIVEMLPFSQNV